MYANSVELNVRRGRGLARVARISLQAAGFCVLTTAVWSIPAKFSNKPPAKKIDYNRDIRQIITKCFTCHGHDSKALMAGLRLDQRDTATEKLESGGFAIVPYHPEKSEL